MIGDPTAGLKSHSKTPMKHTTHTSSIFKTITGCVVAAISFTCYGQGHTGGRELNTATGNIIIGSQTNVINKGRLIVSTGWINHGTYLDTTGKVCFAGENSELGGTSATNFNDLTILASGNVTATLPGNTVRRILKADGTLHANGNITLLSGPSGTALISGEGTGDISGEVIHQRFMEDGFGYSYFSSPFSDGIVSDLENFIDLDEDFPPVYRYDEDRVSSGWVSYSAGSNPLLPLSGYALNFGASHNAVLVSVSGNVNSGSIQTSVFNHGHPYTQGFFLAGNPYPSPIDWDAETGWTRQNIDDAIYFFNASDTNRYTGTYSSYVNGISSDGIAGRIIPAMQGYFVHVSDGSYPVTGTFGCTNAVRTLDLNPMFHKKENDLFPQIRLYAAYPDHRSKADPLVIYFCDSATDEFDPGHDALKLLNSDSLSPSLFALTQSGKKLSISGMTGPAGQKTVPLGLRNLVGGDVQFFMRTTNNLPPGLRIYLWDKKSGIHHRLDLIHDQGFNLEQGGNDDRFFLVFSYDDPVDEKDHPDPIRVFCSDGRLHVESFLGPGESGTLALFSLTGQQLWEMDIRGSDEFDADPGVPTGLYLLRFSSSDGVFAIKILISRL